MPGVQVAGAGGMVDRIPVQMEESQEPEDVNDNAGAVASAGWPRMAPASDHLVEPNLDHTRYLVSDPQRC